MNDLQSRKWEITKVIDLLVKSLLENITKFDDNEKLDKDIDTAINELNKIKVFR